MSIRSLFLAFAMVLGLGVDGELRAAVGLAERVVILANADDADSIRVAEHYAQVRGVPVENIVALPMPRAETIAWAEFLTQLWTPLQAALVERKWIDAIPMDLVDELGRRKYSFSGHRLAYLVVCRGVPLRIAEDATLKDRVPFKGKAEFATNRAAVDAELCLLATPNHPLTGIAPNPLFSNERPAGFEPGQIIKVSRLDGPTMESALALVDHAVEAERTGLLGRAYVDLGGSYPLGDRWLEAAQKQLRGLHFDLTVDHEPATLPLAARFDAPVIYLGWYAGAANGPFLLPGFRFPPGAIALHIHSFSAATVRSATAHWTGPLVALGVTATVGNVFEPYLEFTHRPDLLLRALARGQTWGDAVFYAIPALSWQGVAIGDPLYRPFALDEERQWAGRDALPARLAGYAVVRRMRALEAAGRGEEAEVLARRTMNAQPSLAVAYALAQRLQAAGDGRGAAEVLAFLPLVKLFRPDEWALLRGGAALLAEAGQPAKAVSVYENVLAVTTLPRELRVAWLREARQSAQVAGDAKRARAWQRELDTLLAATTTTDK